MNKGLSGPAIVAHFLPTICRCLVLKFEEDLSEIQSVEELAATIKWTEET